MLTDLDSRPALLTTALPTYNRTSDPALRSGALRRALIALLMRPVGRRLGRRRAAVES